MKKKITGFFKKIDRIASLIEFRVRGFFSKLVKNKGKKRVLKEFLLGFFIFCFLFLSIFILWAASLKTPSLDSFDERLLGQSVKIYDRTGKVLLYDLSQKVRRTVVPFDQISPYLKSATIAIEDIDFYNHNGIKPSSIARAILVNITSLRFSQGGSTITQQVVKNSLLTKDKLISRKVKEWILSLKLERNLSKDEILNLYLNESPYGGNIYGVEEATQVFFAKKSNELTLAEAAYIAALPQAPSLYSPYGKNKDLLVNRKNLVLKKMYENKMITEEEYSTALKEEVVFQPRTLGGIKAPHFVMYVKDYLETKYGDEVLAKGGLSVITTLDWEMQQKAEQIVKKYVLANEKTYKASNAALVATDPKTGHILAMVGSRDYFDENIDGNFNVATARRQPGSAFKPFVYAAAFNKGFLPETPVLDLATQFNAQCSASNQPLVSGANCYNPQNYEGGYKGLMTLRSALAESRNIPAVKLLHMVGVNETLKLAEDMGIQNLDSASRYGLSLALGGAEVSPLDMSLAYGVFANNGVKAKGGAIIEIKTSNGVELEKYSTTTRQVIPRQTASLLNNVLADPIARAPIFGSRYFGDREVGIKTGTTNSSRDAWMIGYTPSISISAWMGNNNNTPMAQQASARIVGPLWKEFADWAINRTSYESFDRPLPADEDLKPFLKGQYVGSNGEVRSELYWIDRANPKGPAPRDGSRDPLFRLWETSVQNWINSGGAPAGTNSTSTDNGQANGNRFRLVTPVANSAIKRNERFNITTVTSENVSQVEFFINGVSIGKSVEKPFSFSFIPSNTPGIEDENEIKGVALMKDGTNEVFSNFFSVID